MYKWSTFLVLFSAPTVLRPRATRLALQSAIRVVGFCVRFQLEGKPSIVLFSFASPVSAPIVGRILRSRCLCCVDFDFGLWGIGDVEHCRLSHLCFQLHFFFWRVVDEKRRESRSSSLHSSHLRFDSSRKRTMLFERSNSSRFLKPGKIHDCNRCSTTEDNKPYYDGGDEF